MARRAILCYGYGERRSAIVQHALALADAREGTDMPTVPPTTPDKQTGKPRDLRTSELLRRAASELAAEDQTARPKRRELVQELQVRALWIERARADDAVSDERRRGVAAIEDVDRGESVESPGRLRCSARERCDFHRDGGPVNEPCPGHCDAPGCSLGGYYEVGTDHVVCAVHGAIVLLARAVSEALAADNAEDALPGP
jgi:hypothetical protein